MQYSDIHVGEVQDHYNGESIDVRPAFVGECEGQDFHFVWAMVYENSEMPLYLCWELFDIAQDSPLCIIKKAGGSYSQSMRASLSITIVPQWKKNVSGRSLPMAVL